MTTGTAVKLALVIIFATSLILWSRGDESFGLTAGLPWLAGFEPSAYDVGSFILVAYAVLRLCTRREQDD